MNPYLLAFSIYALLITPVTLHVSVRVGRQVRYRLRLQAAGLPFLRKIKEPQPQEEHTVHEEDVARTLNSEPWIMAGAAGDRPEAAQARAARGASGERLSPCAVFI